MCSSWFFKSTRVNVSEGSGDGTLGKSDVWIVLTVSNPPSKSIEVILPEWGLLWCVSGGTEAGGIGQHLEITFFLSNFETLGGFGRWSCNLSQNDSLP